MTIDKIRRIAVIGAGLMGHGIAQEYALAGFEVLLHSRKQDSLSKALENIQANLERLIGFGIITRAAAEKVPAQIASTTVFEETAAHADLVVESVYEDAALKQRIFQQLDKLCPAHTILASNTSTLMLSQFTAGVRRLDKVVISHYANPPYLVPIVEIVRGAQTSDETIAAMSDVLARTGKRSVLVEKEVPGFVLNRLQGALLREALWMVENGVASPQDIDTAMRSSIGRRWSVAGVFEVFELAGWDLLGAIAGQVFPHLASSGEVPAVLREKISKGELGAKTGKGFYEWTPEGVDALRQRIAHALVEIERWPR